MEPQCSPPPATTIDSAKPVRASIVVCSHCVCLPLDRCLAGMRGEVDRPEDLVFVANGRQDRAAEWVRDRFPDITIVELPENRYYCGGYNAGIRWAMDQRHDYVLLVNGDTEVASPGFLRRLVDFAEHNRRAAFVGPRVFYRSCDEVQRTALRYPSFWRHFWGWPAHRLLGERPQIAIPAEVEFLNGVCVLCRVAALEQIGLLDENMGGYAEDADWSWRARRAGFTSLYVPEPSVIHHEQTHGYEHHSLKTFMLKRNTVYWLKKRGAPTEALAYALCSLGLALVRAGWAAPWRREASLHRGFVRRLARAYRGILSGRPMGDWFGPPVGSW